MSLSAFERSPEGPRVEQIPRVIAVGNNKGGAGKTSCVANVAGQLAAAGYKVLAVDFDPQGNLCRDLGYPLDDGQELHDALRKQEPLPITANIRPGLDVVKGGEELRALPYQVIAKGGTGDMLAEWLYASLSAVSEPYDIILVDTSPGEHMLVRAVFSVSVGLIIMTNSDWASRDGLNKTADLFLEARRLNPGLSLLGVGLFNIGSGARRVAKAAREALEADIGESAPVFMPWIRYQGKAGQELRDRGMLAHEVAEEQAQKAMSRRKAPEKGKLVAAPVKTASIAHLAEDYAGLTRSIVERLAEVEGNA